VSSAPLAGLRVLDLTRLLPGAACTLHLADLGADVIKIEDTREGDYARRLGLSADAPPGSTSPCYRMINRNKRSLALDLKAAGGRDAFLRLARDADAIVEGFRPGVVDKLGIGYPLVSELNPGIVYCALTGYGQTGPYRNRAGHDINYLGYAGVLDQTGGAHGPPVLSNLQVADLLGGAAGAAVGILAALYDAQRTGRGRYVDVAMTDGALAHNMFAMHALESTGRAPARGEDLLTGGVPCYGVYATQDGRYLAVGALEAKFWRALCETLERPDLIARQFATGADAQSVRAELTASRADDALGNARGRRLPRHAGAGLDETIADEQVRPRHGRHRGGWRPPVRASVQGLAMTSRSHEPRGHGEHTDEVREAGFADEEIDALAFSERSGGRDRWASAGASPLLLRLASAPGSREAPIGSAAARAYSGSVQRQPAAA
jgi:crotonobetainyl-CoA:carnitine CoA-transferase CaiB-like acyl-CoA transferase